MASFVCVLLIVILSLCGLCFSQSAPTLKANKIVTKLAENEAELTSLFRVSCTADPSTKLCSVHIRSQRPSHPCGNCFTILPNCEGTSDYCVWFMPRQGFFTPTREPRYLLTLEAEDEDELTSQLLVDIRVIVNSPPYFDSRVSSVTVTVLDTARKGPGSVLHTVTAVDDDDDTLIYTMTTLPNVDDLIIDEYSGAIRTNKNLRSLCVTSVTCLVTVTDSRSQPVGPFIVNLDFKNANIPPILTNLDAVLYVREDEAQDKTLLDIIAFDETIYPNILYSFSTVPPSMQDYFYFRDNSLKVKQPLDYETQPRAIDMQIKASDGFCDSKLYILKIQLVDVNEPPILLPADQHFETCEGQVDIIPVWNISDPDDGDSWKFTDVQPNPFGRFQINENSGKISTTIDYDLDEERHDDFVSLEVTLSDRQLLTAVATVTVRFLDCNDNAPVFSRSTKVLAVTPCDPVGTVIGGVPRATDVDSDYRQNNVIEYTGGIGLVSVDKTGNLILDGQFKQGQYVTFPIYAKDKGEVPGELTSANPVWITVYAEPCREPRVRTTTPAPTTLAPTTTLPTTRSPNVAVAWDDNETWIICAAVLGGVLVLLALAMFFKYGCPRCLQSCRGSGKPRNKGIKSYRSHARGGHYGKGPGRTDPMTKPDPGHFRGHRLPSAS